MLSQIFLLHNWTGPVTLRACVLFLGEFVLVQTRSSHVHSHTQLLICHVQATGHVFRLFCLFLFLDLVLM